MCIPGDRLTSAMIKAVIKSLRDADDRAMRENLDPHCSFCGECKSLHSAVHPTADPELVALYINSGGAFCPAGPYQYRNPINRLLVPEES